jgi:1-deoxy-D-xylulose-5-phosphate synthase
MSTLEDARFPVLRSIRSPRDIRTFDSPTLHALADEIRTFIIDSVTRTGGHLGAGLGVVELTLALFAEFDFNERDKLVWDVGHQCYPHKLLTGRADRFATLRQWGGMSGFPDPKESAYDTVKTGHGGTSISTAMGFALGWRQEGSRSADRKAVAVIGDGALQEGNAYEALNHGGTFKDLPLVVILNDNSMSISPSVGAMSSYLSRVRSSTWVNARIANIQRGIKSIPRIADEVEDVLQRWYHSIQGVIPQHALGIIFEEFGFFYYGPIDGHDIETLQQAFQATRWMQRPVLIHVVTRKGRGYKDDVPERTCYHAASPSKVETAPVTKEYPEQGGSSFTTSFAEKAAELVERDPRVIVITAAMLEGTGLVKLHERHPDRCIDVGMAEQHAVALAAGLALGGFRPVCAIYSTFLQRAYDQVFQEVALQKARVLFCLDRGGVVGQDGATHNGAFDIGYLRCLPNIALMAPRDGDELGQMMDLAWSWDGPVAIRFPRGSGAIPEARLPLGPFGFGQAERVAEGEDGCILAYGPSTYSALEIRRRVIEATGRAFTVINARFAKPLDTELILGEFQTQPVVFTLEDHTIACGFGSGVAELVLASGERRADAGKLEILGLPDRFIDHGDRTLQLKAAELDLDTLTTRIVGRLTQVPPRLQTAQRASAGGRQ